MKKEVVVERIVPEEGGESTASNAIWAMAFLIIVALLIGFVYYTYCEKGIGEKSGCGPDPLETSWASDNRPVRTLAFSPLNCL